MALNRFIRALEAAIAAAVMSAVEEDEEAATGSIIDDSPTTSSVNDPSHDSSLGIGRWDRRFVMASAEALAVITANSALTFANVSALISEADAAPPPTASASASASSVLFTARLVSTLAQFSFANCRVIQKSTPSYNLHNCHSNCSSDLVRTLPSTTWVHS